MYNSIGVPEYYAIEHSGIKGMKWGVRRYQNADGSLTPAGKARYAKLESTFDRKLKQRDYKVSKKVERIQNRTGGYSYSDPRHNAQVYKKLRSAADSAILTGSRTANQLRAMDKKTGSNRAHKKYGDSQIEGSALQYRRYRNASIGAATGGIIGSVAAGAVTAINAHQKGYSDQYNNLVKHYVGSGGPTSIDLDIERRKAYRAQYA